MDFVLKRKEGGRKEKVLVWPSPLSQPTIRTALSLSLWCRVEQGGRGGGGEWVGTRAASAEQGRRSGGAVGVLFPLHSSPPSLPLTAF
jgi:hypothetical protein